MCMPSAPPPAELLQIKNDGFNAVILVLPWAGFQVWRGGRKGA